MKRFFLFFAFVFCELTGGYCIEACPLQGKLYQSAAQDDGNGHLPNDAIPFISDGHLYLKAILNDTLDVSLVYDTGADFLYLDEDYLSIKNLQNAFGKTTKMSMGGAGNGAPTRVDVVINPVSIQMGKHTQKSKIAPIIKLRDILGCHTDGLLGNRNFLSKPLYVSFSNNYLLPLDSLPTSILDGYTKLRAHYNNKRIYIEAKLTFDDRNVVNGLFLLDMGSASGLSLTNDAYSSLNLSNLPKALYHTQAGGIGGSSDDVLVRANNLIIADTLKNLVVRCSQNTEGALSKRDYMGLIGNKILSLYDIVFDPHNQLIYFKKISDHKEYSKASTIQMAYFDRTDICDGWIVNGLYKNGIAEKAGIEIGDIIISINGRSVKEISWEEQRNLKLEGKTIFIIKKVDGSLKEYILNIDKQII